MTIDAATVLSLLPAKPRLLALGEPTHGPDALLSLRNDLFRQLVEQEGYRTIALESDCLRGLVVDDYVTSGAGTLDEAMARGFSHEWGAFPGNRELVRWMRAHNAGRPADDQVRFAGFDGPLEITHAASPRAALLGLHAHLAERVDADLLPCTADRLDTLLGADERWTNPAAMLDPSQSVGRTPEARELRLLADDLNVLLETEPHHVHGRTAVGLLRYHHWMADPSPSRMAWLLTIRASMMAANLLAIAERGPALVHAHNGHLQRERSSMRMGGRQVEWWSAGAIVATRLGREYAVLATALGTLHGHGVDIPPPDTIEGRLYALEKDPLVVRPADLLGDPPPTPRVSPWFGYAPLDPAQLASHDAIVFVRDAQPRTGLRSAGG